MRRREAISVFHTTENVPPIPTRRRDGERSPVLPVHDTLARTRVESTTMAAAATTVLITFGRDPNHSRLPTLLLFSANICGKPRIYRFDLFAAMMRGRIKEPLITVPSLTRKEARNLPGETRDLPVEYVIARGASREDYSPESIRRRASRFLGERQPRSLHIHLALLSRAGSPGPIISVSRTGSRVRRVRHVTNYRIRRFLLRRGATDYYGDEKKEETEEVRRANRRPRATFDTSHRRATLSHRPRTMDTSRFRIEKLVYRPAASDGEDVRFLSKFSPGSWSTRAL